jgi:diadenosine tetraphosphate (Ap4A) HIT family hydrolase
VQCDDSHFCEQLGIPGNDYQFEEVYEGNPTSRVIAQTDNFTLVCDLAPLVEGHLLLLPKWHALSFGAIDAGFWPELETITGRVVGELSKIYGAVAVLEHGSSTSQTGSSCISHAHWHFIPSIGDLAPQFEADGVTGTEISRAIELKEVANRDVPYYYYYESRIGTHIVYTDNVNQRSQYLRFVVAEQLGISEPEWDWAVSQNKHLLRDTCRRLLPIFGEFNSGETRAG